MKNNVQINILKGIGIISVVLGHTCFYLVKYVYMYHLALFFFVAGFLYNEDKYGNDVSALHAARMKSVMLPFLLYNFLHLLLRNWMIGCGLYSENVAPLSKKDFIINFASSFCFISVELIGSAFWFLPVLITANVVWGSIISISNKFLNKYQMLIRYFGVIFSAAVGVLLIQKEVVLLFHFEEALLVVPILGLGQIYKKNKMKIDKNINWVLALTAGGIVTLTPILADTYIELSMDRIINPFVFYGVTLCGMIFWVWVSEKIVKFRLLAQVISICGQYSFDIMAMHLFFTKLVDLVYLTYIEPDAGDKARFVYSVVKLWPIYLVVGVVGPIAFRKMIDFSLKKIVNFLQSRSIIMGAKDCTIL